MCVWINYIDVSSPYSPLSLTFSYILRRQTGEQKFISVLKCLTIIYKVLASKLVEKKRQKEGRMRRGG